MSRSIGMLLVGIFLAHVGYAQQLTIDDLAFETMPSSITGAPWNPPGTSPSPSLPKSGREYLTPTPAVEIPNADGVLTKRSGLTAEQVIELLSLSEEDVSIEKRNDDGSFSTLYGGATASRGQYRLKYYYYRYKNRLCAADSLASGGIAIGIGLQIVANITTSKKNLNVSGLIPLSVAAQQQYATGALNVQTIGLSSGKAGISSYLSRSSSMTIEELQKAIESFGVVKAILEAGALTISPQYLFVNSDDIGKCLKDFRPAALSSTASERSFIRDWLE